MNGRIPMRGADEYDALTKFKRHIKFRAGARKAIKAQYNRRARAIGRRELQDTLRDWRENEGQQRP
jgi:hypothetical protein